MKIQDQKFNGKIYGKAGSYSIYVNHNKIEVSDADVEEYNLYLKSLELKKEEEENAKIIFKGEKFGTEWEISFYNETSIKIVGRKDGNKKEQFVPINQLGHIKSQFEC